MDTSPNTSSLTKVTKAAHAMQNILLLLQAHTETLEQQMKAKMVDNADGIAVKEVQSIYFNTRRLGKLLDSLLIYEGNQEVLSYAYFDICLVLLELVQEYRKAFPHVLFSLRLPSTLMIEADKTKLTIALRNVLENAIKYGNNQTSGKQTVAVIITSDKKHCSIAIKDQGEGIDVQDISKVFLPFYRGRQGMNNQGSGLGLAITQEIIRFHRGKVEIYSAKRSGVEVVISLPLSQKGKK